MNKSALVSTSFAALPLKVMAKTQLGKTPSKQEVGDLVAFLKSLTGDQPKTTVPALRSVTGTSTRPID